LSRILVIRVIASAVSRRGYIEEVDIYYPIRNYLEIRNKLSRRARYL